MTSIKPYTVLRKVGAGGLADVFVAEVPLDMAVPCEGLLPGDLVALKVMREPERSVAGRQRFVREGEMLQRLRHPGLPRCFHVVDDARPYLVLEFLVGHTLKDLIRDKGPLEHALTLRIADAILRVLVFLHDSGVVHRDIKPGNIFLCDDGRVLLLDLGLAADPTESLEGAVGDVMGTYAYMAPEQIAGAALDHRADLYSLGITVYECITSKRPYRANGPAGYLRAHTVGGAPPMNSLRSDPIPAQLDELVGRLMARDPAVRPQTAALALAILTGHQGVRRALARPPLVGRQAALGAIEGALDEGSVVHLVGERGMGTVRLAEQAREWAQNRGLSTFGVRCRARLEPLAPLRELRVLVSRALGPLGPQPSALAEGLSELLGEGGILLLIEEIDQASPELVDALTPLLSLPGLSVVTTAVRALAGLPGEVVPLRELTRDEVHTVVAGMLGTTIAPAGLADKLHRFTGGLPAAVVFTVRDFFDRGVLVCTGIGDEGQTTWRVASSLRMQPDNSLNLLFRPSLEALDPSATRLLELLSVAREALPVELACRVARVEASDEPLRRLVELHLATFTTDGSGGWLSVRRQALGALVAAQLSEETTRACNAALARAIGEMPRSPWRDERLPFYQAYGASSEQAALALVRMGEWLESRGRHAQALEVLTRATHEEGLDMLAATRCALARGQALRWLSRPIEALDALHAAKNLAKDQDRPDLLVSALVGMAEARFHHGEVIRALELAEEALRILGEEPGPMAARAQVVCGDALAIQGDLRNASARYELVAEIAGKLGDGEAMSLAHAGFADVFLQAGRTGDAIRHLLQECAWQRGANRSDALVTTLVQLARARLRAGDIGGADEAVAEAERLADETGLAPLSALAAIGRSWLQLACGDAVGANELLRRHWFAGEPEINVQIRGWWLAARAAVRLALRDHNAALATCNQLVEEAGRVGWEAFRAYHAGVIAVLRGHGDDLTEALDTLADIEDHHATARLLLTAARIGGDAEVLDAALVEAREAGDRMVLLEALHAVGGRAQQKEAYSVARNVLARAAGPYARMLEQWPPVWWALGRR